MSERIRIREADQRIREQRAQTAELERQLWRAIGRIRRGRRITQREIAARFGVERAAWANYEIGRRSPDPELRDRIIDFFGAEHV